MPRDSVAEMELYDGLDRETRDMVKKHALDLVSFRKGYLTEPRALAFDQWLTGLVFLYRMRGGRE